VSRHGLKLIFADIFTHETCSEQNSQYLSTMFSGFSMEMIITLLLW